MESRNSFDSKIIKESFGIVRRFKDKKDHEEAKKEVSFLSRKLKIDNDLVWSLASCKVINRKLGDWWVEVDYKGKKYKENYNNYSEMFQALEKIKCKVV
jgi:hypothetical protein